jgi:hypothetical protein
MGDNVAWFLAPTRHLGMRFQMPGCEVSKALVDCASKGTPPDFVAPGLAQRDTVFQQVRKILTT